ncbi:O-Antigen ligase [Stieleria maiorica]|uniref:O-Antigen ligase n=1 Tax=Stieleria maiorica TaxID=2795974 RepID=A0A5B9MJB5_9BACT|nr:O-antigen ligase family protein [Stieleria maiorica]QEG00061.1 O-Antigen ligase [Stieleria maiorica]
MAKTKQRVKPRKPEVAGQDASLPPRRDVAGDAVPAWAVWCRRLAAATLGGLVVYVAYHPSDSVLVESGDALWFCALSLIVWTLTLATEPMVRALRCSDSGASDLGRPPISASTLIGNGLVLDVLVWGLAVWMMAAALASCPPGNLRQATNEAWVWIAAAAVLTAARRLLADLSMCAVLFSLLAAVATAMAVHALHQEWISLPQTRAEYLADPEAVLRAAGVVAPRGSAARMVFANRLLDGGPTATFALANSLAAMMLVAALVPLALLRDSLSSTQVDGQASIGRAQTGWIRMTLVLIALIGVAALLATRSRSALVACLTAGLWIWIRGNRSADAKRFKTLATAVSITALVGGVVLVALLLWGDDEWMAAAPASLEFRLQYWKSTALLLLDHPWLGAGPGGFQAMYLQYRLPVANESIADPHNFVFETLAAGGLVGGLLLGLVAIAAVVTCRRGGAVEVAAGTDFESTASHFGSPQWMVYGALVSLGGVWGFSLLSGQWPDFQASVIALPSGIATGWLTHRCLRVATQPLIRLVAGAILLAVMTHLLVSGGWTVPGVAIVIWMAVASLGCVGACQGPANDSTRIDGIANQFERSRRGKSSLVALGVGVVLLACLRFESIIPVQQSQLALRRAEDAARRGMLSRVESESRRAVQADTWGSEAPRWRSEFLKGRLIELGNDRRARNQWQAVLQIALDRAGANPMLLRAAGEQHLHLYQCFGQTADLEAADRLVSEALAKNPTDLSLVAQAAVIADERSETAKAGVLADRARQLSGLGGNIVRDLGLQQILIAEKIGAPARRQPVSRSIKDRFRERPGLAGEPEPVPGRSNDTSE